MRLIDLEAVFVKWEERVPDEEDRKINPQWSADHKNDWLIEVADLSLAHGIHFTCPKCVNTDGHMIQVFFKGSPAPDRFGRNKNNKTVRWSTQGTDLTNLSLQPSILLEDGCGWHGFITNGEVK